MIVVAGHAIEYAGDISTPSALFVRRLRVDASRGDFVFPRQTNGKKITHTQMKAEKPDATNIEAESPSRYHTNIEAEEPDQITHLVKVVELVREGNRQVVPGGGRVYQRTIITSLPT